MSSWVGNLGFLTIALLPSLGLAQCPTAGWAQFCGPVSDIGQQQFNACMARCEAEWGPSQCGGLARPNTCWSYTCVAGAWKQQAVKAGASCSVGGTPGNCTTTGTCTATGNGGGLAPPDQPWATVGSPIQAPQFVNLYWDDRWDVDNPTLPKASLDAFTAAMASSSYFTAAPRPPGVVRSVFFLSEYGVNSATFGGGFLPATVCTQRSPSRPGFWDPIAPSIMGFLQCEIDHGGVPKGGNVIYNIILPAYAIEQDLLGNRSFCRSSGGATAWHFHDTPYDPTITAGVATAGVAAASVGGLPGGLPGIATLLGLLAGLHNGPVWTITMTSSSCQSFTTNLLHEMVEAATDPFPPLSVAISGGNGEIADNCHNAATTASFAPQTVSPPPSGSGSVAFANSSTIAVPQFWSNASQSCEVGFSDPSAPGSAAANIVAGQGGTLLMTITTTGGSFGALPPSFPAGNRVTLPYIGLQDLTQGWEAGNSLNSDQITLDVSWPSPTSSPSQTITVTGVGRPGTDFTMKSTDQLSLWVCNPQSGHCAATCPPQFAPCAAPIAISMPPGPYLPNLAVALAGFQSKTIAPYVTFSIDGKPVGSLFGEGNSTGWMTLGIGSHTVSASVPADTHRLYKVSYTGACNANGVVTLNEGDNRTCDISVKSSLLTNWTGCATGETCCEPGANKCSLCVRLPTHGSCP
jgi:hypothetical protein